MSIQCAAVRVPGTVSTVKMVPGSLRPNDSHHNRAGENRAGGLLQMTDALPTLTTSLQSPAMNQISALVFA